MTQWNNWSEWMLLALGAAAVVVVVLFGWIAVVAVRMLSDRDRASSDRLHQGGERPTPRAEGRTNHRGHSTLSSWPSWAQLGAGRKEAS